MAEQNSSLHIDTDWKKQAQEEKRKLAEREAEKTATAGGSGGATAVSAGAAPAPTAGARPSAAAATAPGSRSAASREMPPASFATLVQTIVTQALFYLGDLAPRGGEPVLDLDKAKHQIDLLGVIEEKTANNLTPEEKRLLDAALYESRMRYISVSSQFLGP